MHLCASVRFTPIHLYVCPLRILGHRAVLQTNQPPMHTNCNPLDHSNATAAAKSPSPPIAPMTWLFCRLAAFPVNASGPALVVDVLPDFCVVVAVDPNTVALVVIGNGFDELYV